MMQKEAKIYVAGHNGMVGSAISRKLENEGYSNIVFRTSKELDLRDQYAVNDFFESQKPEYIFLAAAKVGGIMANSTYKADFIYDNLMMQNNIIHASHKNQVNKLLFLGSSCIYPKEAKQPIQESYLLTGALEPTNEPYAIAKIAGLKLCEFYKEQYGDNFFSIMPTNLYGPNDNYDLQNSHVLPALIRKFHEAKINGDPSVELWGSGMPKREFLYVEDLAEACVFLMNEYNGSTLLNVGTGKDLSILELAEKIKKITNFKGEVIWDKSKPDGTLRKLLDVSKVNSLGWEAKTSLDQGIKKTYEWYIKNRG
jgi:GDP-L-fucose synthase